MTAQTKTAAKVDVSALNREIDALNGDATKIGDRYQEVGLKCLQHLGDHGDVGPVNRLYLGMPKSSRRLAMAQWFIAHGKLKVNPDRNSVKAMPLVYAKDKEMNMEGATNIKWWEFAPEKQIEDTIDLQVAIKSLLNRVKDKKILFGGVAHDPHEAEVVLRTMAGMVGLKVDPIKVDAKGIAHTDGAGDAKGVTTPEPEKQPDPKVMASAEKIVAQAAAAQADGKHEEPAAAPMAPVKTKAKSTARAH